MMNTFTLPFTHLMISDQQMRCTRELLWVISFLQRSNIKLVEFFINEGFFINTACCTTGVAKKKNGGKRKKKKHSALVSELHFSLPHHLRPLM